MTSDAWCAPRWLRTVSALVPVVVLLYGVTLLPGARGDGPRYVPWLEIGVGDGTMAVSGLVCLARAAYLPADRLAWSLLGVGPLLYVGGDIFYYLFLNDLPSPPYPSGADGLWLSLYPAFCAGLLLLVRSTLRGARKTLWLDGLTGGFGAAALLGAAVLRPVLSATGGALPTVLTNLAYPVCDLTLLTVVILVFNLQGWRPGRVWWLLGWVAASLLVVDSLYLLQVANGTYVDGGLIDVGWSVAFATLGPAACRRPATARRTRQSRLSVAVPALLSVLSTVVLFAGAVQTMPVTVAVFGLLTLVIATIRLSMTLFDTWRVVVAQREARTDELTGLPNRRRFLELVRGGLREPGELAVMIVDLDGFKQVNDSLGHGVGDELLQVIGSRLRTRLQAPGTVVARLGGDEFAVLVTDPAGTVPSGVAARLRELVGEPAELAGISLEVGASVGIAMAPEHGTTWGPLMSRADTAMYVAKRDRTGVELFSEDRARSDRDRLALLAELRGAVEERAFVVHYQPAYSLVDRSVTGVEALVRWPHAERGLLAPDGFLPVAVEAGLSRRVTDLVLAEACAQAATWRATGLDVPVAVNLFEADLTDPALPERVSRACQRVALPPDVLQLELSESATAAVVVDALPTLRALRDRGHRLVLDDFGAGHASLSMLADLPLDAVKLDRSFLAGLSRESRRAVVLGAVQVAHAVGLEVVAEGVETHSELDAARVLGCDAVQGYLMQRPADAGQLDGITASLTGMGPDCRANARVSARRERMSGSTAARTPSSSSPIATTEIETRSGKGPSGRSVSRAMNIDVSSSPDVTAGVSRRGRRGR